MNNGVSYTSTKPIEEFEINKKNKPSDLISRLSELRSQYSCFDENERDAYHTLSEAIEALKAQATLDDVSNAYENGYQQGKFEATQKTGKWIWKGEEWDSRFMCSVCYCKENVPTCNGKPTIWKYCPNCGSLMRGGYTNENISDS